MPALLASLAAGGVALSYSHYTFDINGQAFAFAMKDRLEAQLHRQGQLPPGVSLDAEAL